MVSLSLLVRATTPLSRVSGPLVLRHLYLPPRRWLRFPFTDYHDAYGNTTFNKYRVNAFRVRAPSRTDSVRSLS